VQKEKLRVLVVDDFELIRIQLVRVLKEQGIVQIDEASDGQVALEYLQRGTQSQSQHDLVFCDWVMPRMDGLEFLKVCREQPQYRDLTIIMVTAESEPASVMTAIKAGANDYLCKPIAEDALAKKIEKIVSKLLQSVA
jgi:two-component system chemotaxis response regulator CheY